MKKKEKKLTTLTTQETVFVFHRKKIEIEIETKIDAEVENSKNQFWKTQKSFRLEGQICEMKKKKSNDYKVTVTTVHR